MSCIPRSTVQDSKGAKLRTHKYKKGLICHLAGILLLKKKKEKGERGCLVVGWFMAKMGSRKDGLCKGNKVNLDMVVSAQGFIIPNCLILKL